VPTVTGIFGAVVAGRNLVHFMTKQIAQIANPLREGQRFTICIACDKEE